MTTLPTSRFAANTYSYTLQYPVRDCVERLGKLGFREFELMMYPGHLWPAHMDKAARRELKDYLDGNGMNAMTFNMPNVDLNIAAATTEMRNMTMGILRQIVELAGEMGVEGVVIGPGKANPLFPMPKAQLVEYFYQALNQLVPLAQDVGTSIYVENMPFAFLPNIEEMLSVIEQYGDPRIGVVYDVANGHFVKEDVCASLKLCAPRLRVVHLSDTNQTVYRHDAVGLGTVDFAPVPATLREIGFKRRPVLEIIGNDPDGALQTSVQKLEAMGWGSI